VKHDDMYSAVHVVITHFVLWWTNYTSTLQI